MNSVLLNLLKFVLWSTIWSLLDTVPSALKRMYSAVLGGMFCGYVRSVWFLVFKSFVSLLNFCLTILSIIEMEFQNLQILIYFSH